MQRRKPRVGQPSRSTRNRIRSMMLERFEDRRMLAQVQWISDTSGFWDVAANWSTGTVPGATDDVIINRASSNPVITVRSGVQSANSIQSSEFIVISGGSLSATQSIDVTSAIAMQGGTLRDTILNTTVPVIVTSSAGTVSGVTVNGDLDLSASARR